MLTLALASLLAVDGGLGGLDRGQGMPVFDPGRAVPVEPRPWKGTPARVNETEISATGLSPDVAHRTLARVRPWNKACYERGLVEDPKLAGTLTLALELDAAGLVTKAVPTGGSLKGTEVAACLVRRAFSTQFPEGAPGRTITATLNFELQAVDGGDLRDSRGTPRHPRGCTRRRGPDLAVWRPPQ